MPASGTPVKQLFQVEKHDIASPFSSRSPVTPAAKAARVKSPLNEMDGVDMEIPEPAGLPRQAEPGTGSDDPPVARQQQFEQDIVAAAGIEGKDKGKGNHTDGPLTLTAIGKLIAEHLRPIQQDIAAIKLHGVSQRDLQEATGPLKASIEEITTKFQHEIEDVQIHVTNMENNMNERFDKIKQDFEHITSCTPRSASRQSHNSADNYHYLGKRAVTAVVGNLDNFDDDTAAAAFLRDRLSSMSGPIPKNMYSKGEFKNIVFAEFDAVLDRDTAVALSRSGNIKRGSNTLWASPDREPAERAARNFCFGLKHILKNDLDNPYVINVTDEAPYQVYVGGQLALSARVTGTNTEREWEGEWGSWAELHNHHKVIDLIHKCDSLVQRASMGMKGGAKGKSKGNCRK